MDFFDRMKQQPKHEIEVVEIDNKHGGWNKGFDHLSPEAKKNIAKGAAKRKGKNNAFYGKTHSDETKSLMSAMHKGKTITEEQKQKCFVTRRQNKIGFKPVQVCEVDSDEWKTFDSITLASEYYGLPGLANNPKKYFPLDGSVKTSWFRKKNISLQTKRIVV